MKLSVRFILDNLFVIAGALIAIGAMTWTVGVAHWVALGVSAAVAVLAAAGAIARREPGARIGQGLVVLAAVWSIIASVLFHGTVLTWLVFADAIAVGVLAMGDLTGHEAVTQRAASERGLPRTAPPEPVDHRAAA